MSISQSPMKQIVAASVSEYLVCLEGAEIHNLYDIFMDEVEPAIFQTVLQFTGGNQSRAAEVLGLNRGTLRSKLLKHNLLG